MAHDCEIALLTKIIHEQDIRSVIRQKVTYQFFADTTNKEIFHFMVNRFQKFGRVPSMRVVKQEFPEFAPQKSQEDLMELVSEIREAKLYADMAVFLKQTTEATRQDPYEGFSRAREMVGKMILTHQNSDDVDFTKSTDDIWMEFKARRDGEGMIGIPYPWPYLNKITLGMHPGDLIGIYARPKKMKSWLGLVIADHVHQHTGKTPGFFSGEMPVAQIQTRLAALRARLPYAAFRSGQLTAKQTMRFRKALRELRESPPFMICKVDGVGEGAIAEVRAKCEEYQIDLAICDGIYFWMEDESHKAFRTITRGLKKTVADALKIPVVGITQANRGAEKDKGKTTQGVAFGDSLAQDCDQLMYVIRDQQHEDQDEVLITMPAMREAKGGTFSIHAKPAEDFSEKFVFDDDTDVLAESDDGSILGD
jgi:replicative DNA helicase